jgi:hypothetical protein
MTMEKFLNQADVMINSYKNPVITTFSPPVKKIYLQNVDDEGEPSDQYDLLKVSQGRAFDRLVDKYTGLVCLSKPEDGGITNFDDIIDGEKYVPLKYGPDFADWQKNEANAMEAETLLSMEYRIRREEGEEPVRMPRTLTRGKKKLQEWDGVLLAERAGILYLLESKHSMTPEKICSLHGRINQFPSILRRSDQKGEFDGRFKKIVGVACGTDFSEEAAKEAMELELDTLLPNGSRYDQDIRQSKLPLKSLAGQG